MILKREASTRTGSVILTLGFCVLVALSIYTVAIPELRDDTHDPAKHATEG